VVGSLLGKIHINKTKALISEAKSGENHPNFDKFPFPETRAKLREANIDKNNLIFVYNTHGLLIKCFSFFREAGKYFNSCYTTIKRYFINGKLFKKE
jgi:hypothetical protein